MNKVIIRERNGFKIVAKVSVTRKAVNRNNKEEGQLKTIFF